MAKDELWARVNGDYAREKHSFLERFAPPALNVTAMKPERHFVDLFAGPGRNVDTLTGEEYPGAAITVARMVAPGRARRTFTHAWYLNKNEDEHAALSSRLRRLGRDCVIQEINPLWGDANVRGPHVMRDIATSGARAYALVFADPGCPSHLPWSTVKKIGTCGLQSVDLYVLMPLDMGLNRMLPPEPWKLAPNEEALTAYFGTEEWRRIYERYGRVSSQRAKMRVELLELYKERLSEMWGFVEEVRDIRNWGRSENHRLYRMLFCTRNETAMILVKWERSTRSRGPQLGLGLEIA